MAFGDLKGSALTGSGASITSSNALTGSQAVVVGDLIWVTFGQQTNLTASGVTDNLGNTYVPITGFDGGNVTVRGFYARVTVAGTLTTVTVAASSSANDWAGSAVVIEGPFLASDMEASTPPTPVSDTTTPYSSTTVGTMDNTPARRKAVVAYAAHNANAAWTASAGTKGGEVLTGNIGVVMGVQVATGASVATPNWTGTAPGSDALGVIAFNWDFSTTATLAPAGAMTADAVVAKMGSATFGATGGLTLDIEQSSRAVVSYASIQYTLPVIAHSVSATFAGAGGMVAQSSAYAIVSYAAISFEVGGVEHAGAATLAGAGALSANALVVKQTTALFQGAGSLTTTVTARLGAQAAFNGVGALTVSAARVTFANTIFDGTGALSARAVMAAAANAAFSGAGALNVNAIKATSISATFGGEGALNATTSIRVGASALFGGAGGLSATVAQRLRATALFSGAGALSTTSTANTNVSALFSAAGGLSVTTTSVHQLSFIFNGSGGLSTDLIVLSPANLEATFKGAGGLSASTSLRLVAAATFFTEGSFASNILRFTYGTALFNGTGGLSLAPKLTGQVSGQFSGEGALSADAVVAGAAVIPVNLIKPVVSGTAAVGQLLSCSTGTWAGPPTAYTYQWYHLVTSGGVPVTSGNDYIGVPIVGATSSTYMLVEADAGEQIFCDVTASNSLGTSAPESSNLTAAVFTNFISAVFGGSGALAVQTLATINVSARFAGAGALAAVTRGTIQASAIFGGSGALTGAADEGQLRVVVTYATVSYSFVGSNTLEANFGGTGGLGAVATIPLNILARFDGAGSLDVSARQAVSATTVFGGTGGLTAETDTGESSVVISYATVSYNVTMQFISARFDGAAAVQIDAIGTEALSVIVSYAAFRYWFNEPAIGGLFAGEGGLLVDAALVRREAEIYDFPIGRSLGSDYGIRGSKIGRRRLVIGRGGK